MNITNTLFKYGAMVFFLVGAGSAFSQSWSPASAPSNSWASVACSGDGTVLAAVSTNGFIYTSSNYGSTWLSNSAPAANWTAVACSADGTRLVASGDGEVFTNAGTTWAAAFSQSDQDFTMVACSADGSKLVTASSVVDIHGVPGLFVSTNSGLEWSNLFNSSFSQTWVAIACSGDGDSLAGAVQSQYTSLTNSAFYTSSDGGTHWITNNVPAQAVYTRLSFSADGSELLAATSGGLLMTTNAGSSWMILTNAPQMDQIACSSNGVVLFGTGNGQIYSSGDAGATWATNSAPPANWLAIAVSSDGARAVAVASGGAIYLLQPPKITTTFMANALVMAWPATFSTFHLQQGTSLTTSSWSGVTNVPTVTNTSYQTAVPINKSQQFFRLRSP